MPNKPNPVTVFFPERDLIGEPLLPSSKSESNRALMLSAYSKGVVKIENLSESDDTKILKQLLEGKVPILDVGHSGSTFRFLTTYLALYHKKITLTGSIQIQKRPIGILVDALRQLGSEIDYLGKSGYPPLSFRGFKPRGISDLKINPTVSSQFITSLMMAAPTLPGGLNIQFSRPDISSFPYLVMTWRMMQKMGIQGTFSTSEIRIPHQDFEKTTFEIESDWSSASYWLAMACMKKSELTLNRLSQNSLQGDSEILAILKPFGLKYSFSDFSLKVFSNSPEPCPAFLHLNLNPIPDLAQTLIAFCVLKGIPFRFSGLQSLAIKETNRLMAMKTELAKMGISLHVNPGEGTCEWPEIQELIPPHLPFETHEDHRMALSLSLFALRFPIKINNPGVVSKSYPGYWEELKKLGFTVQNF